MSLPAHLEEFCIALDQEIAAARQNSASSAIPLSNGRFVAKIGPRFQYVFESSMPVRVPPDSPGELILEDDRRLPVEILSGGDEGLQVTISSLENLGRLISAARLFADLTMLLKKLQERIREKGEQEQPAGERVLGQSPVGLAPAEIILPEAVALNSGQRSAAETCLTKDTTFIWGPPGTGKTFSIGAIAYGLFKQGRSLLMVSHTNVAVDGAILKIAEYLKGQFNDGEVFRIGEPVKTELKGRDDILLDSIVERRTGNIKAEIERLELEIRRQTAQLETLEKKCHAMEWAEEAAQDIQGFEQESREVAELASEKAKLESRVEALKPHRASLQLQLKDVQSALVHEAALKSCEEKQLKLGERIASLELEIARNETELIEAQRVLEGAVQAAILKKRLNEIPSAQDLQRQVLELQATFHSAKTYESTKSQELLNESAKLKECESMGYIKRALKRLPSPQDQKVIVDRIADALVEAASQLESTESRLRRVEMVSNERSDLEGKLQKFPNVPTVSSQKSKVGSVETTLEANRRRSANLCEQQGLVQKEIGAAHQSLTAFREANKGRSPSDLLEPIESELKALDSDEDSLRGITTRLWRKRDETEANLKELLEVLEQVELTSLPHPTRLEAMVEAVNLAYQKARQLLLVEGKEAVYSQRSRLSGDVDLMISQRKSLEQSLATVEEDLIKGGRVIATTLTRAFLRQALQGRKFDTVIIDESSMAPIPALWAASTLALRNVTMVGDFRQLPPICQASQEGDLAKKREAEKWLGRDIFKASGVQDRYERKSPPDYFVALTEQHRMHPEICSLIRHIYEDQLTDGTTVIRPEADECLKGFWNLDSSFQNPVTGINIRDCAGWGNLAGKSRINAFSAVLCVEIATSMCREERESFKDGDEPRILIVSPYRPQANLIAALLRDKTQQGQIRSGEIVANTAHSFQGSEAPAVIIDLVVDEPHFSANLLTPKCDEDIRRLINVAVTRAKRRVVVVGDFEWIKQKGRSSWVPSEFLPKLNKKVSVSGLEVLRHHSIARNTCPPEAFLPTICAKVNGAEKEIIVYSPEVALESPLIPPLVAAQKRGVRVSVIYDHKRRSNEGTVKQLKQVGLNMLPKRPMHENLVLVDGKEAWISTFAPVSIYGSGVGSSIQFGFATSRNQFLAELSEKLAWKEIIGCHRDEPTCPVCGCAMVVGERIKSPEYELKTPFSLFCETEECYSRGLDEPPIKDGMIQMKCGEMPEFTYYGRQNKPFWICGCGKRHRVRIKPAHLKLPRMLELIPARSRAKVEREVAK